MVWGICPWATRPPRAGSGPDSAPSQARPVPGRYPRETDKRSNVGGSLRGVSVSFCADGPCVLTWVCPLHMCLRGLRVVLSASPCVCLCPCVGLSVRIGAFCVSVSAPGDLSWRSGLGSELRSLAQKATVRPRTVLGPLSPRPLPTASPQPSWATCTERTCWVRRAQAPGRTELPGEAC